MKDRIEIDINEALDWELKDQTLRQALTDEAEKKMFAMPSVAPEGHFEIGISLFVGRRPENDSPGNFVLDFKAD